MGGKGGMMDTGGWMEISGMGMEGRYDVVFVHQSGKLIRCF